MERVVCVVFAKPPRAGHTKTRLAAVIGPEAAASLAGAFLQDTVAALRARDRAVVISTPDPSADHGVDTPLWDQGTGELGARLEQGFRRALGQFEAAIALGADSPGLPAAHLDAMESLLGTAAVLGPTDDGGFWGLALHTFPEGMLLGLPWSTTGTAAATRARVQSFGLPVLPAPGWWDVDRIDDLDRLRREVARVDAPATHAVLDALRWP